MSLIRPDGPDPSAPDIPAGLLSTFSKIQTTLSFFFFLPHTLVRTSIKHLLGHYPSWQPYTTSLMAQTIKLLLWCRCLIYLPKAHEGDWEVVKPIVPAAKAARVGMGVKMVTVKPAPEELIVDFAIVPGVKGVERAGYWVWPEVGGYQGGKDGVAKEGEKVIYYLHGGAYIFGHPIETAMAWNTSRKLNVRVFGMNYRKTLSASTAHPAPLLDALAGYIYLIHTLKFRPENITITGESAGGHLILLLTRYLVHVNLPIPTTLALSSPWADFTSRDGGYNWKSHEENYETDYIPYLSKLSWSSGMRWYTMEARRSLWFSPVLARGDDWDYLKNNGKNGSEAEKPNCGDKGNTRIRVYIMYGNKEILADEILALYEGMKQAGVDVFLRKDVDGLHVGPAMAWKGSDALKVWLDDFQTLMNGGEFTA